jgi:hypothetical protein
MEASSESLRGLRPLEIVARIKAKALGIIEGTLEQYKSGGLKLPTKEVFLAKAESLYKTLCDMTDIPMLGPAAESAVESILKPAYMKTAEFLYDRFAL